MSLVEGLMSHWKVPVWPRSVAGPVAVHRASLRLGWKEKEKLKQLAEGVSP
jgi:hypothetical protein